MKSKVKIILCVLAVLIIVTVAGSSVHNWLLPKVKTTNPRSGNLKNVLNIDSMEVISTGLNTVSIPEGIAKNLTPVYTMDKAANIQKDTVLARYDISAVKTALLDAKAVYAENKEALMLFKQAYREELNTLRKTLEETETSIRIYPHMSDKDRQAAEQKLDGIREKIGLLEDDGVYQGKTLEILETKFNQSEEYKTILETLIDNNGEIKASAEGTLVHFHGQEWSILPEGVSWSLIMKISAPIESFDNMINPVIANPESKKRYPVEIQDMYPSAEDSEKATIVFGLDLYAPTELLSDTWQLEYLIPAEGKLVPSYAFVTDSSLFISEKNWNGNKMTDRARMVSVKAHPGNDMYWIVTEGLSDSANIIISWDREITDGGEIAIEP